MMKLQQLIRGTTISAAAISAQGIADLEVSSIGCDSRKAEKGSLFVALPGPKTHGVQFVKDATDKGAKIIVGAKNIDFGQVPQGVHTFEISDPQEFLATALKNFYSDPSSRVRLVGITGTNGKTTITYLLESLFAAFDKGCGVIGTINHRYGGQILKAGNTTPGLVDNYELLSKMAQSGMKYCAMEVSSHALDQRRVEGLHFAYAIFTNLTSDHLDYHKDRESYFLAKAKLFTGLSRKSRAIINIDDEYGPRLLKMSPGLVWTYGLKNKADFSAENIVLNFEGTSFDLVTPIGKIQIVTPLIGKHNIYNLLCVAAVGVGEGMSLEMIKKGLENVKVIPGRLERIEAGQDFFVFVDYAHTQDAFENVLSSIRAVKKAKITVVFGCGGDRDKTKRPKMAAVVERLADFAIVTNDNPRSEDPDAIVRDIVAGFKAKKYEVVLDRKEAITQALNLARKGDVVLIAGKGHEDYQIFRDKTVEFDERKIVLQILKKL